MGFQQQLGDALGHAVQAEGLHQGDEVADLRGEVVDEHLSHFGMPVHDLAQGCGGDQPALGLAVGLGAGGDGGAIKHGHLTHAVPHLEELEDLDPAPTIRPEDLEASLDHHEDPRWGVSLGEDPGAVGEAAQLSNAGQFFGGINGEARQKLDPSQVEDSLRHGTPRDAGES